MLLENFQVNSKIPHQGSLQAIVIEMSHVRNMRSYAIWVFLYGEQRYMDRRCSGNWSSPRWSRENQATIFDEGGWIELSRKFEFIVNSY